MRRHRSAKALRRRAELNVEKAKDEFIRLLRAYMKSASGQELITVYRAFDVVAKSDPKIAEAAQLAFIRQHPVFGPMIKFLAGRRQLGAPPAQQSDDEIANDVQALEDFRRILLALPTGKAALATKPGA